MAGKDLSLTDASSRAERELGRALTQGKTRAATELVSVEEALRQERIVKAKGDRSAARVLFISQDTTLLNPTTQTLDGFLDLRDLFEEVHILILRTGIPAKYPALRVTDNVWLYTASSRSWWTLPLAGIELAEQELVFATGFRPDLIVARDPFESALVGKRLAEQFDRPLQIHVLENYAGEKFRHEAAKNFWRRFIPRRTIPAATSVRADTAAIMDVVTDHFHVPDVALLPKYHAYESYITAPVTVDLKQKYPQFVFFYLYIGTLGHESTLFRALDALRFVLQNPRVGLVVAGQGPAKKEFMKRAELLGISEQVIFELRVEDVVSYMKTADVLIVTDTDAAADEVVLKGAAAGVPLIMAGTDRRADYFEAGVTAHVCPADDTGAFAAAASDLLNNPTKRHLMREYAQGMIRERFHLSKQRYRQAFRDSIEKTLFVEPETTES